VAGETPTALESARREARLSPQELWLRYFGLGGFSTLDDLWSYLNGSKTPDDHNYDLLVDALNERFMETGHNRHIPYHVRFAGPPPA
jgi:hypothetical protein